LDPRHARRSWPVYVTLAVFAVAMIGAMAYVLWAEARVNVRSVPRVDAVMEIKLSSTLAHLWFEEVLSGDRNESIEEVRSLLDRADRHAGALLEGARDPEETIVPVEDVGLRGMIAELRDTLHEFRLVTEERWEARNASAAGTLVDQRYDEIFAGLMARADEVETAVRRSIRHDRVVVRRVQTWLIVGGVLLSVLVGVVVTTYLSQRDRAEEEAGHLRERLTHVTRVGTLGEMATGIAHEINQPLTAISATAGACSRFLRGERTDFEELRRGLDQIAGQALRAGQVVGHLRSLVSRRVGTRKLVAVNEVVRDAARLAEIDARLHECRIRLDLGERLPAVAADPVQIQQVLINLIRNGMDAMESVATAERGIALVTRTIEDGRAVEIAVVDRGTGISDEEARQLFAPFFTTKESGLGLGLSISRTIVTSHGGRLWYTRNPGRGLTLHVSLPAAGGDDDDAA